MGLIRFKNPFSKSVVKQAEKLNKSFSDIITNLSKLTRRASKEIASNEGYIHRLKTENDGLGKVISQNDLIANAISKVMNEVQASTQQTENNAE